MARCPSCDYPLPGDRERLGARCPNCRDPLYEPPGRFGRPARPGEAACAAHPGTESVGRCNRCGNALCEACRCRWRDEVLCVACVNRALDGADAAPEAERAAGRCALWSTLLGGIAWLIGGLAVLIFALAANAAAARGEPAPLVGFLFVVLSVAAAVVGLFGVGLGTAALRGRTRPALAVVGTVLSGLLVGCLVGLFTLYVWQV